MDKLINWTLAAGAVALAFRSIRDAYVGNLSAPSAGITTGSLEGVLSQTGSRRRIYVEGSDLRAQVNRALGGPRDSREHVPCAECAEDPSGGCCG